MHNGAFGTIGEVLTFYRRINGLGGR